MTPNELNNILNAHPYVVVQRPPMLWATEVEVEPFVRLLGEMLAAGLSRNGQDLSSITLNIANVEAAAEPESQVPAGAFVAVTVRCKGDWSPEGSWSCGHRRDRPFLSTDFETALADAGAAYAYARTLADGEGSVTVFLLAEPPADRALPRARRHTPR
jgi:hypothetical protein